MRKILMSILLSAAVAVSGCANRQAGDTGLPDVYGIAAANNLETQIAYPDPEVRLRQLNAAFKAEAPDVVTFAFNSASLDSTARAALDQQAAWLRANRTVRMSVVGHTDLVGTEGYNDRLGMRRARAVVAYLTRKGVSRKRLDAIVSKGESEPVVQTEERERRNRRTVTQVSGYDFAYVGTGIDGEYAQRVYDNYQAGDFELKLGLTTTDVIDD